MRKIHLHSNKIQTSIALKSAIILSLRVYK